MKVFALLFVLFALTLLPARAADNPESRLRQVLERQVEDWNRGDIPGFVKTYAPDCVFVGKEVAHGREQLLARYQRVYPDRSAMGRLSFANLEVHLLREDVAIVTGQWHLERSGKNANVGGVFSLVLQRNADGWLIALDHTS